MFSTIANNFLTGVILGGLLSFPISWIYCKTEYDPQHTGVSNTLMSIVLVIPSAILSGCGYSLYKTIL